MRDVDGRVIPTVSSNLYPDQIMKGGFDACISVLHGLLCNCVCRGIEVDKFRIIKDTLILGEY